MLFNGKNGLGLSAWTLIGLGALTGVLGALHVLLLGELGLGIKGHVGPKPHRSQPFNSCQAQVRQSQIQPGDIPKHQNDVSSYSRG